MSEPTITCPKCRAEIKLTESLAAPLLEATRSRYEQQLADKDADVSRREAAIREQQAGIANEKKAIDEQVAAKLLAERQKIVAEEARKARLVLATDLDEKAKEIADLKEVLEQREAKLAEAQQSQADLSRKQRELDDAKREMDLTIEKRVQESLAVVRETARKDAESLQLKMREKDEQIASMQRHYEQERADKDADVSRREAAIREQKAEIAKEKKAIDEQVSTKLFAERQKIVAEEAGKARLILAVDLDEKVKEITDLKEVLQQRDAKLAEAQQAHAVLIRKQRELDDAKREMDLTIEKRVQESLGVVREKARKDAEEVLQLKVREKEEQIISMQRQIEVLKRKAEQGSQQLQGEVQELELEAILCSKFPRDTIEPIAKGAFGGDLLHRVFGPTGQHCGTILWEAKRTRTWSDGWLAKLRNDQRAAKAEIAVIVSHALPKALDASFDFLEGVWVTEPRCAVPVAVALRELLIALAAARHAGEGQLTKMEMVYQYLTGPRFRQRVEAIVEKFTDMQADLDRERRTMTRLWAKREEQIRGVIESTAGMYGDLQGIAGKPLQEIEGLEVQLLGQMPFRTVSKD